MFNLTGNLAERISYREYQRQYLEEMVSTYLQNGGTLKDAKLESFISFEEEQQFVDDWQWALEILDSEFKSVLRTFLLRAGNNHILNATPHAIWFRMEDGEDVCVQPSGYTLLASSKDHVVCDDIGLTLVEKQFHASEQGQQELDEIYEKFDAQRYNVIVVSSIISAQAWPYSERESNNGQYAVCLVTLPGFERSAPNDKRHSTVTFSVF